MSGRVRLQLSDLVAKPVGFRGSLEKRKENHLILNHLFWPNQRRRVVRANVSVAERRKPRVASDLSSSNGQLTFVRFALSVYSRVAVSDTDTGLDLAQRQRSTLRFPMRPLAAFRNELR